MRLFSLVALAVFVAGYSTARWALVTRLYELVLFAWDYGVVIRAAKGFVALSVCFVLIALPLERLAAREIELHPRVPGAGLSAREQLKRRGSF